MSRHGWLRKHRATLVVTAAVLVLLGTLTLVSTRNPGYSAELDPENPQPSGAQAVARVLEDRGVEVDVARAASELARADVDRRTTLLVTSAENLGRETAEQFRDLAADAGAVVVADPSPTLLRVMDLPLRDGPPPADEKLPAACDDPLLGDLTADRGLSGGLDAESGEIDTEIDTETCFHLPDRPGLAVRVDGDFTTYAVVGVPLLGNRDVESADNAAAALRLLGQRPRLVWYVPDLRDIEIGDTGSVQAQLPRALEPGLWLLAAATLAMLLWRVRRLGPLVVEPLPVTVKAIESTKGRGRLYRRTRDRRHAAQVLRAATVRRLAARLRLPSDTSAEQLVAALSPVSHLDPNELHDLLVRRHVPDDRALTRLAADLSALEKETHRP